VLPDKGAKPQISGSQLRLRECARAFPRNESWCRALACAYRHASADGAWDDPFHRLVPARRVIALATLGARVMRTSSAGARDRVVEWERFAGAGASLNNACDATRATTQH
jgi:hypothetical protein